MDRDNFWGSIFEICAFGLTWYGGYKSGQKNKEEEIFKDLVNSKLKALEEENAELKRKFGRS